MAKKISYKDAGVDIAGSDSWTEDLKRMVRNTYGPRVLSGIGGFAGLYRLDYDEKLFQKNYKKPVLVACTDGVGTKLVVSNMMKKYDTIGIDLVAMNVNDMIVCGAEPLVFLDYMAIGKLRPPHALALAKGITEGCRQSDCALLGGETAEMPDVYDEEDYDLAGFAVGVVELSKVIDGSLVEPGDVLLGLASSGIHSNGYSLVRRVIFDRLKMTIDDSVPGIDHSVGEELLIPTRIYVKSIRAILEKYATKRPIRAMAHITGGGLPGNVVRVLPKNCRAVIDTNAWPTPKIFEFIQRKGPVDTNEMFRVFNMGIGMVLVVRSTFAASITAELTKLGERVYTLGRIKRGSTGVDLK